MKVTDSISASPTVGSTDSILTIEQVGCELKCSKSHVYNIINSRVPGVKPLPVICLGRKKLVRRAAFEAWKLAIEANTLGGILVPEPEVNTVGA